MTPAGLAVEDGLFEVADDPPLWIWARCCSNPGCECRMALVLASGEGRRALLECAVPVHAAWRAEADDRQVAAALAGATLAFSLDLDTVEVYPPKGEEPLDLARNPEVSRVVQRLDGEVLDQIARLWYRGKGWEDPERSARPVGEIRGWSPGDLLAWNDAYTGVRQDLYVIDDQVFEAVEMYCPTPSCGCGEVTVQFTEGARRSQKLAGGVIIQPSGRCRFDPGKPGQGLLDKLWRSFQARHPDHAGRFAGRAPRMKDFGALLLPGDPPRGAQPRRKVGRNDPCPCGSGKKSKKCCGRAPPGGT